MDKGVTVAIATELRLTSDEMQSLHLWVLQAIAQGLKAVGDWGAAAR